MIKIKRLFILLNGYSNQIRENIRKYSSNLPCKYLFIFLTCGLMSLLLGSCMEESDIIPPSENDSTGVIIRIPMGNNAPKFSNTRAEDIYRNAAVVGDESNINNIYLIVISKINNQTSFEILKLGDPTPSTDGTNTYLDYRTPLETGNYKFYLIANIDDYLSQPLPELVSSENQFNKLVNEFTTSYPFTPGNLPMVCLKPKVNGNEINGQVYVLKGTAVTVETPLSFLCSKVRYTILFDARENGFSKSFGDKRIRFLVNNNDLPYAANIGGVNLGSSQILNPDFNSDANGWDYNVYDNDRAGNRTLLVGEGVGEFYYCNFDFSQTLYNMPAGNYTLQVQGFYREGWISQRNETEKINASIYLNEASIPFKSLFDEDPIQGNYPADKTSAEKAFNTYGKYINILDYSLEKPGELKIGLRKSEMVEGDWTCFDNFILTYTPFEGDINNQKQNITLNKYWFNWDATTNPDYPLSESDDRLNPWTDDDDNWNKLEYKAWQGVTYFPENTRDKNNKTVLYFPYCYGEETTRRGMKSLILFDQSQDSYPKYDNGTDVTHGLVKGMMYDIVIKVVHSEIENDKVKLYMDVKNWNYNPEDAIW